MLEFQFFKFYFFRVQPQSSHLRQTESGQNKIFISQKGNTSASSSEVNMAEATPVAEESTMNRSSSHQIVSVLQVAEVHLKTNGNSTLGQEELPGLRPSSQPAFSFQFY